MLKLKTLPALITILVIVLSVLSYNWATNQPLTEYIAWFAETHTYALIALLVLIKIIGLVWPPVPGGIATVLAIPFIGWQMAYLIDLVGTIIGAVLCYLIAKKWGYSLLSHIFDTATLEKIASAQVTENRQAEFGFTMTILSRLVMTEISFYAAGILRLNFWKFMLGAVGSHVLLTLPSYYFAKTVLETTSPASFFVGLLLLIPLVFIVKKRYFEKKNV